MEYYYLAGIIIGLLFYSNCTCHGYGDKTHDLFAFSFSILAGLAAWPFLILIWYLDRN